MANISVPEKAARRTLSLLELAEELGNVSKACKIVGYSRQQFKVAPQIRNITARLQRLIPERTQQELAFYALQRGYQRIEVAVRVAVVS